MKRALVISIAVIMLAVSTGSANAATIAELRAQIDSLILQISALSQSTAQKTQVPGANVTTPDVAHSCLNLTRNFSRGMRGDDVRQLQQFLISQNLLAADSATGFFGPLTEKAVQAWQMKNNIVSSGTPSSTGYGAVGPRTRAALRNCTSFVSSGSTNSTPATSLPINTNPAGVNSGGAGSSDNNTSSIVPSISPTAASCSFNGQMVASGSSVTAYQASSVAYGGQCVQQSRTCTNGTLNGSYTNASCSVAIGVPIDVFVIAGQSNALGQAPVSTLSQSPHVPTGKVLQYYQGVISDANDSVGGAVYGSAWPAFGVTYYNATGRGVAFVPAAVGATTQSSKPQSNNWDVSGPLVGNSMTQLNAAMLKFVTAGYAPTFKGVLWHQGESDVFSITEGIETVSDYSSAFKTMVGRYRAAYGSSMPFYIFQIGMYVGYPIYGANFAAVRSAQETAISGDPYSRVVFRDAINYPAEGMMQGDGLHYTQAGYNKMGAVGAANVLALTLPASPTGLVASCNAMGTQATLSWNHSTGATDYYLRVNDASNDSAGCASPSVTGPNNSCVNPTDYVNDGATNPVTVTVTPGRNYSWWVHAGNAAGINQISGIGQSFSCVAPSDVPTGLSAQCSASSLQATFSWNPVQGATSYALRVNDTTNEAAGCAAPSVQGAGGVCVSPTDYVYDLASSPTTLSIPANKALSWWVHAMKSSGPSAAAIGTTLMCVAN